MPNGNKQANKQTNRHVHLIRQVSKTNNTNKPASKQNKSEKQNWLFYRGRPAAGLSVCSSGAAMEKQAKFGTGENNSKMSLSLWKENVKPSAEEHHCEVGRAWHCFPALGEGGGGGGGLHTDVASPCIT